MAEMLFSEMLKMSLNNIKVLWKVLKPDIIQIEFANVNIYDNHVIDSCNEIVQRFHIIWTS